MSGRCDWDKDRRRHLDYKRGTAFVGDPPYKEQPNPDRDLSLGSTARTAKRGPTSEGGGNLVPHPVPKKDVFYLLDRKAERLTPLQSSRSELREGEQYVFKSTFQATDTKDALLIVAYGSGGSLHFEVASCSCRAELDGTVWVTVSKLLLNRAVPLTDALFLDQCASVIPAQYDFEVFRAAVFPPKPA